MRRSRRKEKKTEQNRSRKMRGRRKEMGKIGLKNEREKKRENE